MEATATTVTFISSNSDGYLRYSGSDYPTVQAYFNASVITTGNTTSGYTIGQTKSGSTKYVSRSYLYFDTSSLIDTINITSAKIRLYGHGDSSTTDFNITVQHGTTYAYQHDPLVTTDYAKGNYTGAGGYYYTGSGWSLAGYNNVTLNADGMSWINITGWTKFCLRSSRDISITAPTGSESVTFEPSEYPENKRPKLEITYTIDPTASTSPNMLRDPFQRKTFWYGGRAWLMFNNDTNGYAVLTSSSDGVTWKDPIYIGTLNSIMGEVASLYFNGSKVHFVWSDESSARDLYYRMGTPSSDGSITLTTPTLVYNGTGDSRLTMPSIAVDSFGYPWIGADWNGIISPYTQARIYKSSWTNGTWNTDFYYNLTQTEGSAKAGRVVPLPMTNGKIAFLHQKITDYVYLNIWNGTGWSVENETASLETSRHGDYLTAVTFYDDIHMSYLHAWVNSTYSVLYRKRIWGSGWEASETIIVADAGSTQGAEMNWGVNDDSIRIFWSNHPTANHIYYRRRFVNGTWESTVDWKTSTETLTDDRTIQISYKADSGEKIVVCYQTGAYPSNHYHFKYEYLAIPGLKNFEGSITVTITLMNFKTMSFNLNKNIAIQIAISGMKLVSFSLSKVIALALTVTQAENMLLNLAKSINLQISVASIVSSTSATILTLFGTLNLLWAIQSSVSASTAGLWNFYGSIALTLSMAALKLASFNVQGTIPLTFTITSSYFRGLNLLGNIALSVGDAASHLVTFYPKGNIALSWAIVNLTSIYGKTINVFGSILISISNIGKAIFPSEEVTGASGALAMSGFAIILSMAGIGIAMLLTRRRND